VTPATSASGESSEGRALLDAATDVIAVHGLTGLTLERLADAAGTSRMTLHRRGVTIASIVTGMGLRAASEWREGLFPVLAGTGPADSRLYAALAAMYDVADRHLALLAGLFAADDGIFHAEPDETGALPTAEVFVSPLAKLLTEGASDGTLELHGDAMEAATVLFNVAGWGYVQLRHTQRWPAERAQAGITKLVLSGLLRRQ